MRIERIQRISVAWLVKTKTRIEFVAKKLCPILFVGGSIILPA
jgi:hypothetical protein